MEETTKVNKKQKRELRNKRGNCNKLEARTDVRKTNKYINNITFLIINHRTKLI